MSSPKYPFAACSKYCYSAQQLCPAGCDLKPGKFLRILLRSHRPCWDVESQKYLDKEIKAAVE
jgi:hypothetical protein